jgi:acid phosphatase (class A)
VNDVDPEDLTMSKDCIESPGTFPDEDWVPYYKDQVDYKAREPLFDPSSLQLPPPADLAQGDECVRLQALRPLRAGRAIDIRRQAQSDKHAIQPVFDVIGLDVDRPPNPQGLALRARVQDNLWGPIFHFKACFNRNRPWNCCPGLEPLLQRPDRLYPGHPSYPSGHATMAYTWAYLFAVLVPARRQALEEAAAQVAFNREVAGVHFPSDSEAGRQLAEQVVALMTGGGSALEALADGLGIGLPVR